MTTDSITLRRARFLAALTELTTRESGPMLIALENSRETAVEARRSKLESTWHRHPRGQLICIDDGIVHMRTERGAWLLQPQRAGWVPPNGFHSTVFHGVSRTLHLLLTPAAARYLPAEPCVMGVNELSRALMRRAATWTWEEKLQPAQRRLVSVLLEELRQAPRDPVHLPMPSDRRLLRIANAILDEPTTVRSIEEMASTVGISRRTVHRLFDAELGMSFVHWRQRAMLVEATRRLAQGESVANVADALGYASPSNFIAMFKRHFGDSPARYFDKQLAAR